MTCHSQPWKRLGRFTKKNLPALTHSMENDWNTHRSGRNQRKPISKHSLTGLQSKPISKLWTYFTHFVSRLQNSYIKEAFSHIKRWSGLKVKLFHQTKRRRLANGIAQRLTKQLKPSDGEKEKSYLQSRETPNRSFFTMLRQPECKRTFQDKKVGSGVADNLETMVTVGMICINLPEYQCAYI